MKNHVLVLLLDSPLRATSCFTVIRKQCCAIWKKQCACFTTIERASYFVTQKNA